MARSARPARPEIDKLADMAFGVSRDRILNDAGEKRNQVLHQVRLTGNSAGFVPALVKWAAERVRQMVLAHADAYVEAFSLHNMPSDALAETDLRTTAQQITAGTISSICGDLDLNNRRTGQQKSVPVGYVNRQISSAMNSSLQEGLLRLKRQEIMARNARKSDPAATSVNPTTPNVGIEECQVTGLMHSIEKWRQTAAPNGGKLTQKEVCGALGLDRRAYSAAKRGKPRGTDHYARISKFAKDRGVI
jgi:hypothetical protein